MEGEGKGMDEAKDLIEKLLVKDPRQRLGCTKGATDIKRHPFFDGIKWPLIRNYKPPEVRGLVAKKGKSHSSGHVLGGVSSPRRKCWWRLWKKGGGGLGNLLRNKGSSPRYYLLNNSQHYNDHRRVTRYVNFGELPSYFSFTHCTWIGLLLMKIHTFSC
ncbi:hypothetical protein NC652_004374 [Populus alba x Populus x berolinensis]|nr:hypothetical protein NC652_004374 [Populus alba x Populus x berolinensis]